MYRVNSVTFSVIFATAIIQSFTARAFADDTPMGEPLGDKSSEQTALPAAQCVKDTDCKGDRICENGRCSNPPQLSQTNAPQVEQKSKASETQSSGRAELPTGADQVSVTMIADSPSAILQAGSMASPGASIVCGQPCNGVPAKRSPQHFYVVAGDNIIPSTPFVLPPDDNKLTLKVDVSHTSTKVLGATAAAMGLVGVAFGGTFFVMGSLVDDMNSVKTPGLVVGLISVPLLVGGLIAAFGNNTHVRTESGQQLAKEQQVRPLRFTPNGFAF